jgi:hypothetical protein
MKLIKKYPDIFWSAFLREDKPVVVDITSIAECAGSDIKKLFESNFGHSYFLPWPRVWFEFTMPDGLRERVGVAMRSMPKDQRTTNLTEIEAIRTEHVIDMAICVSMHGETPTWLGYAQDFRCKEGKSVRTNFGFPGHEKTDDPKIRNVFHKILLTVHKYVDVALTFLNCKNVIAETHPFPESKKRKQTIHESDVVYKKLVVLVPRQRKPGGGSKGDPENNIRLHVCRGHFADHRERGLFGKEHLRGIYWVPMHVKGSKEVGEVVKQYELRPKTSTTFAP